MGSSSEFRAVRLDGHTQDTPGFGLSELARPPRAATRAAAWEAQDPDLRPVLSELCKGGMGSGRGGAMVHDCWEGEAYLTSE